MESNASDTKIVFDEWCQNTTCHGVSDCHHSQKRRGRAFWSMLSVIFISILIVQSMLLTISFLQSTHYTTNVHIIDNVSMLFPNVTVCNMNRVNRTKAKELGMTSDTISQLFLSLVTLADVPSLYPAEKDTVPLAYGKHMKNWLEFINKPNLTTKDPYHLFRYLGHSCEETLKSCSFTNMPFDCCQYAIPIVNSEYGLCWSVTPPALRGQQSEQMLPGALYGLNLKISPALNQYSFDVLYNNYLEQGVVIAVNFNPFRPFFLSPTVIPPGTHARIALGVSSQYTHLPPPFLRLFEPLCTQTGSLMHLKGPYDRMACLIDCFQNGTFSVCNCTLVGEKMTKYSSCTPTDMINCFYPKMMSIVTLMQNCAANCKEPCGYIMKVTTSVSMNPYPTQVLIPSLAALWNVSHEKVRSLIQVDIFYPESSSLTSETVEKTSISNFIASIGGAMGLWLGASLVTIIQAFYYIFYCMLTFFHEKNKVQALNENDTQYNKNIHEQF